MEKLIKGLTHKAFHVSDMEASLRFYCDCLGLPKMFEIKDDEGKDWLLYLKITDGQYIELFYGGEQNWDVNFGKHICFEVSNIEACIKRLNDFGYSMFNNMKPLLGKDNNLEAFVQDPDGNLIELMQFGPDALQFKD